MLDTIMQTAKQLYIKLVQANLELVAKIATSPEAVAQAPEGAQSLFQQGQEAGGNLLQSTTFAHLAQGMLKNYTDFLIGVGKASMAMLTQSQAAMLLQPQDASGKVLEASRGVKRGGPQAGEPASVPAHDESATAGAGIALSGTAIGGPLSSRRFLPEEQTTMDMDNLPTLEEIRSQRLLTPLQIAEMEGWFWRSRLFGRPLEMSPGLARALRSLQMLVSLRPDATMH